MANKDIPQGAATTLYACLSPTIDDEERGAYLVDCAAQLPNVEGQDVDKALRTALWNTSESQLAAVLQKPAAI
jgi:hypothetical protein